MSVILLLVIKCYNYSQQVNHHHYTVVYLQSCLQSCKLFHKVACKCAYKVAGKDACKVVGKDAKKSVKS